MEALTETFMVKVALHDEDKQYESRFCLVSVYWPAEASLSTFLMVPISYRMMKQLLGSSLVVAGT